MKDGSEQSGRAPLACTLGPADLRDRRAQLGRQLESAVTAVEPVAGGYRLWFDLTPDRLERLAALIEMERACCAFLDFALVVRAGAERVSLAITGPDDARDTIRSLFVPSGSISP